MPKTKVQKGQEIDRITNLLKTSSYGVLTDFTGLSMADLDEFRAKAREQGVRYTVVKTSLLDIAAKNAGLTGIATTKQGKSYALAYGGKDEVAISKLINDFARTSEGRVNIYVGIINGEVVGADMIIQLAALPSYEELLGKVVGSMNAPIANFVYSMNYTMQSFYNVVKAVQSAKS